MVQERVTRCPRCRQPVRWQANPDRPFCSERCRLADLGNWAQERYRISGEPISEADLPGDGLDGDEPLPGKN